MFCGVDGCTTVCLTIPPLEDIWVVSSLRLLQINLLWMVRNIFLCEYKFQFLWDKCPIVQLPDFGKHFKHMFSFVRKLPILFFFSPEWLYPFTFLLTMSVYKWSRFSASSPVFGVLFCCCCCFVIFNFSHSDRCVMISHCGCNLYFSNG